MTPLQKSEKRIAEQLIFAQKLTSDFSPELRAKWDSTNSSHKFFAYRSKEVVAYLLMFGRPTIVNTFVCEDVSFSLADGFSSVWSDSDGKLVELDHAPREVAESCFMYHPKSSYIEHTTKDGQTSMKFSMLYRTARNPGTLLDGVVYLLERAVFEDFVWGKN